ncbi:sulfotransferase family protein [Paenibacillus turpanensis]|uniref:sulfotransferase family protein n=1 Tax=Paenibacillus turpanensis TaxID=2689078 RepID=UPI001409225A|nr:sulfotransferase [Paenibacillus turpanensis]
MVENNGENLVFLLCVPRSGSSLATVMLQNHTKVFATQEMWFLMSLYDLQHPSYRPYGGTGIIKQFFNGVMTSEIYEQACRAFSLQVYNGLLQSSQGAQLVVDKSPRYYYLLEFLDRLFPKSKRIWLVRNPLDIVASYKKVNRHTGETFDLKQKLLDSQFNIKMADITVGLFRYIQYFSASHEQAYRLQYERLAADPEQEMLRLCEFLGLPYEKGIEQYGQFMDSAKSELFFSMGVGDPYVGKHDAPHLQSINNWKDVLDKEEVEMYCSAIGAQVFYDLGYGDQLEEAERYTGVTFTKQPNEELLSMRAAQLMEASGCNWIPNYRLSSEPIGNTVVPQPELSAGQEPIQQVNPELLQLQIKLRTLERRFDKCYIERERYRKELSALRGKVNRMKAIVPFGKQMAKWASTYLVPSGRRT